MRTTRAPRRGTLLGAALPAFALAWSAALGGCFLADPRPDPYSSDGGGAADSGIGGGTDSAAAAMDAGAESALAVTTDDLAVSGGSNATADVAVVGFMDPALANVGVEITNATAMTAPVVATADTAGGFVTTVQGVDGDELEIVVLEDGPAGTLRGPPVSVTVGDAADLAAPLGVGDPDPADGMLTYDAGLVTVVADGLGNVTVTGSANATSAGAEVVAGNLANGASAVAVAIADGSFMLTIAGATGDMLVLFARVAGGGAASQTQVVTVP